MLNYEERMTCKRLITKGFKTRKTMCIGGFPVEVYRFLWPDITLSFGHVSQTGKLPINQRREIISLIFKKSKDKFILENQRPIALVDNGSLPKPFQKDLKKVPREIINVD